MTTAPAVRLIQGAVHALPTVTHSRVTWSAAHEACMPPPVRNVPGLTGVRQCLASRPPLQGYHCTRLPPAATARPGLATVELTNDY